MFDILALNNSPDAPYITVIFTTLLSFLLSTMIAITYEKTFKGLSYSRNFVQALILGAIVAATVMHAIGDSLARGLGMLGALAIIRFRTSLRDPRDMIFMFAALASGISCGVCGYSIAIVGSVFFCMVAYILYITPFGQTSYFDGMLRFSIENIDESKIKLEQILKNYCRIFALVTLREMSQGKRLDYAYHIKLKNGKKESAFIQQLSEEINSIKGISLLLQETTVEL